MTNGVFLKHTACILQPAANTQPALRPRGTHPACAGYIPKGEHSSSMGFTDLLQVLPSDWGHHMVQCSQLARLQVTVGHTARLLHPSSLHLSTLGLSQPAPPRQCIPLPRPHHRGRVGTDPGKRLPSHVLSKLGPRGSSLSQMPELQAS